MRRRWTTRYWSIASSPFKVANLLGERLSMLANVGRKVVYRIETAKAMIRIAISEGLARRSA
jgi:hypothetical protein